MSRKKPLAKEKPQNSKDSADELIEIRILGHSGNEINFSLKPTTPLGGVKLEYCELARLKIERLCFKYDGHTVKDSDTPRSLKMENREIIEVHPIQIGRSYI